MSQRSHTHAITLFRSVCSVLCVLLVLVTGFVAAVHSHPTASRTSEHLCSVCALAHAGAVPITFRAPSPIFTSSALHVAAPVSPHSLLAVSSLYIRPPPVV